MTLGEISEVMRTGKTPPTENAEYFDGVINWYTPGDLNISKELASSKRTISQLAINDKKASLFPENSLLISCIGELGKLGISREVCASNQQITAIKPKAFVNVDYLFYWFINIVITKKDVDIRVTYLLKYIEIMNKYLIFVK